MNFIIIEKTAFRKEVIENINFELEFQINEFHNYYIIYDKTAELQTIKFNSTFINITTGYIDSDNNEELRKRNTYFRIEELPLPNDTYGQFSTVIIDIDSLLLMNDPIGIYPLYYSLIEKNRLPEIITNNYLLFSEFMNNYKLDLAYAAEVLTGPEYSEIGSRTPLKELKRLLPGEFIKFHQNQDPLKKYDNRLFSNISTEYHINKLTYTLERETQAVINNFENETGNMALALSAGLDSRLTLASLGSKFHKNLKCYTYGPKNTIEVKLSQKIAEKFNLQFENHWNPKLCFPNKIIINKYLNQTNSLSITNWLSILENKQSLESVTYLGDMCESMPARNIGPKHKRENRINRFFKSFIYKNQFDIIDKNKFEQNLFNKIINQYSQTINNFPDVFTNEDSQLILKEIKNDYCEIINRVFSHNLKYQENAHEIYSWFVHARIPMGKQVILWNHTSTGVSPSMGIGILTAISNIDIAFRIDYQLISKFFKQKKFSNYISIATAQNPFIPLKYTNIKTYLFLWGIRSKIDNFLLSKKLNRLFPTINWRETYQHFKLDNSIKNSVYNTVANDINRVVKGKKWPLQPIKYSAYCNLIEVLNKMKNEKLS